jgi:chromosome segregation ATPase
LEITGAFAEIKRLDSETQKIENALNRHDATELALSADIKCLVLQKQDTERLVEESRAVLQAKKADQEAAVAAIHRFREEMKQEMSAVVDQSERAQLVQLRQDLAMAQARYKELAGQLANTEGKKSRLEILLKLDLEPGVAALKSRMATSQDRDSQLGRLCARLAAAEEKRASLLLLTQELTAKEMELAEDQRRLSALLESTEAKLKKMEKDQTERMELKNRLTSKEAKLRRQLAEKERRHLEIGLVLPSSQITDSRRDKLQKCLDKVNKELNGMDDLNQKALIAYSKMCKQRESLGNYRFSFSPAISRNLNT